MNSEKKFIVITGGTSGIGEALVHHFAKGGFKVLFTGRNQTKAASILEQLSEFDIDYLECDFASLSDVAQKARSLVDHMPRIDVLINNAGTWQMQFVATQDGLETNFAVNHLAPMLFTLTLLPHIKEATGRIINTSSGAHRRNILDLDDLEWKTKTYDGVATYSQSKLCNLLFTNKLSRILQGSGILVNSVHPGYVKTELFNKMGERNWKDVPDATKGARSAIFAATDTRIIQRSNLYIYLEGIDPNLSPLAVDNHLADQLWEKSMEYLQPFYADTFFLSNQQKL